MLVVPLVGLAYFGVSGVVDRLDTASQAGEVNQQAQLAVKLSAAVHQLQRERGFTSLNLASKGKKFGAELSAQRKATTDAVAALQFHLKHFDAKQFGSAYAT